MEPMLQAQHTSRKKNSAKVNLTISVVIHGLIFALGAYWAAHEGVLGKKLQELSVGLLPKEKKPDPEKPKEVKTKTAKKADEANPVEQEPKNIPAPQKFGPPPRPVESPAPLPVSLRDVF